MSDAAQRQVTIAYSDASLVGEGVAGIGALVAGRKLLEVVQTRSLQHAELQAALLALRHAPVGGPLRLHLDCTNALQQLTRPDRLLPVFRPLILQILTTAGQREIELTVQHISGDDNPAHPLARRARYSALDAPVTEEGIILKVRQVGTGVMVQGLGEPRVFADRMADLRLVGELLSLLPERRQVVIEGLGLYTRYLYQRRAEETVRERPALLEIQRQLISRRLRLTLR